MVPDCSQEGCECPTLLVLVTYCLQPHQSVLLHVMPDMQPILSLPLRISITSDIAASEDSVCQTQGKM